MKAQYLKNLLKVNYSVADFGDYIGIGSSLCHNLIKLDKKTMKVSYAVDTFHQGKECLRNKDSTVLLDIWNKLEVLIESGEITDILEGNDTIENPLTVCYEKGGEIIETTCAEYGWPNTTISGKLMYDNEYYEDPKKTAERALYDAELGIKWINESIEQKTEELKKRKDQLCQEESRHDKLEKYLKE